jgi:peptidyl-prolyl cis-trans isomerase B (cyclophilin B)
MPPMLKRALLGVPALVLLLGLAACGEDDNGTEATDDTSTSPSETATVTETAEGAACQYLPDGTDAGVEPPPSTPAVDGEVPVTLTTSVGEIRATLDGGRTPCTVNSFVSLAEDGYFDGTSCHRLTTEGIYVLQCGDPTGSGAGGPGYSFADELDGTETYGPGTLAMANAGPNTNGSQFFIVYGDSPLPPSYTVFGRVDEESVAVVEEVAAAGSDESNGPGDGAPNTPVDIESVTTG